MVMLIPLKELSKKIKYIDQTIKKWVIDESLSPFYILFKVSFIKIENEYYINESSVNELNKWLNEHYTSKEAMARLNVSQFTLGTERFAKHKFFLLGVNYYPKVLIDPIAEYETKIRDEWVSANQIIKMLGHGSQKYFEENDKVQIGINVYYNPNAVERVTSKYFPYIDDEYVEISEAAVELGISTYRIRSIMRSESLDFKVQSKTKHFIDKATLLLVSKQIIDRDLFINQQELTNYLGIPTTQIRYLVSIHVLEQHQIHTGTEVLYHRKEIDDLKAKHFYNTEKWMNIYDFCKSTKLHFAPVYSYILKYLDNTQYEENTIYKLVIECEVAKKLSLELTFDANAYFTLKEALQFSGFRRIVMGTLIREEKVSATPNIKYEYLVLKSSLEAVIEKYNYFKKNGYSIDDITSLLGFGRKRVLNLIHSNEFGEIYYNFNNSYELILEKSKVDEYLINLQRIKDEYYKQNEIKELFGPFVAKQLEKKLYGNSDLTVVEQLPGEEAMSKLYLKSGIHDYIKNLWGDPYLRISTNDRYKIKTASDVFNLSISEVKVEENVKRTINLYQSFFDEMNSNSLNKDWRSLARQYAILFLKLFKQDYIGTREVDILPLKKNLSDYISHEVDLLIGVLNNGDIIIFKQFLDYCANQDGFKCDYKESSWSVIHVKDKSPVVKILLPEYYLELMRFAIEMNKQKHKVNAISDSNYASHWLFLLLHFNVGWRKGDMLNLFAPDISNLIGNGEQVTFEYLSSNTLTYAQALRIQKQFHYTDMRAHKSLNSSSKGNELVFSARRSNLISLITAIVICRLHMLATGRDKLISYSNRSNGEITLDSFRKFLQPVLSNKSNDEIKLVNSTSITNTFLTHLIYDNGNSSSSDTSLILAQSARAHTLKGNTMIMHYIAHLKDGPWHKLVVSLCEHEFFGGNKLKILEIMCTLNGNRDQLTYTERSEMLELMKPIFPRVRDVEDFAGLLTSNFSQDHSIAVKIINKEINEIDKDDFTSVVVKLIKGEMPAKIRDAQCLAGGCHRCPFSNSQDCKSCEFVIPSNMILISLGQELNERAYRMATTTSLGRIQKENIWISRITKLIGEAMDEFGEEAIIALIPDYDFIIEKLKLATMNMKTLQIEEGLKENERTSRK
ncbi:hypothetical protein [Paenibacillus sp. MBLB4367]|uniref:hypothetical protein n=1 Tax=Paenibacillus sp. MBLB4367 TaxID=3384767 RepID=UPI003908352D